MGIKKLAIILVHALVRWALCGATIVPFGLIFLSTYCMGKLVLKGKRNLRRRAA
jgi:hypothetical protein